MTLQGKLKAQAYKSNLKSRALSVLIYLIDRSDNKDLTCFPSISTIAGQLHISISTVKRAIRELLQVGFILRDSRYRKNKGQTSNLYTLVLQDDKKAESQQEEKKNAIVDNQENIKYITFESLACEKQSTKAVVEESDADEQNTEITMEESTGYSV